MASHGVKVNILVVTSDPTYVNSQVTLSYLNDGPAAKRNAGVRHATADTIIFLDDDVEVSPYCLYELWKFLQETPKCGIVFSKIYNMERRDEFDDCGSWITWTGFLWARAEHRLRDDGQYNLPTKILSSKSATCAVRLSAFQRCGGFDRDYFILGEETDLAWRMWLLGWEVWYTPTATSWHAFGCESLKPRINHYTIERTMTYGCRNYLSLLWTNLGVLRLFFIFPFHWCLWWFSALGFLLKGDWRRTRAIIRGMGQFVRRLPGLQLKRARVQASRVLPDRTLWPLISATPHLSYYWSRMRRYWTTQLHG